MSYPHFVCCNEPDYDLLGQILFSPDTDYDIAMNFYSCSNCDNEYIDTYELFEDTEGTHNAQ